MLSIPQIVVGLFGLVYPSGCDVSVSLLLPEALNAFMGHFLMVHTKKEKKKKEELLGYERGFLSLAVVI